MTTPFPIQRIHSKGRLSLSEFDRLETKLREVASSVTRNISPRSILRLKLPFLSLGFEKVDDKHCFDFSLSLVKTKKDLLFARKKLRALRSKKRSKKTSRMLQTALTYANRMSKRAYKNDGLVSFAANFHMHRKLGVKEFMQGTFVKEMKELTDTCKVLDKANTELETTVFSGILFPLKRYRLLGDLDLPLDFPLSSSLEEKLGGLSLDGFVLTFEKSPLGVDKCTVQLHKDGFLIHSEFHYKTSKIASLPMDSYLQALSIGELFVEKIK